MSKAQKEKWQNFKPSQANKLLMACQHYLIGRGCLEKDIEGFKAKSKFSGKECCDLLVLSTVDSEEKSSSECRIFAT